AVVASAEGVPQVDMILKKSPFTAEEKLRIRDFAQRMGFRVWALPGEPIQTVHSQYIRTPRSRREAFLAQFPLTLTATSDDNPFFVNFYQWRYLGKSLNELDVGHTLATGQLILAPILLIWISAQTLLIHLPR